MTSSSARLAAISLSPSRIAHLCIRVSGDHNDGRTNSSRGDDEREGEEGEEGDQGFERKKEKRKDWVRNGAGGGDVGSREEVYDNRRDPDLASKSESASNSDSDSGLGSHPNPDSASQSDSGRLRAPHRGQKFEQDPTKPLSPSSSSSSSTSSQPPPVETPPVQSQPCTTTKTNTSPADGPGELPQFAQQDRVSNIAHSTTDPEHTGSGREPAVNVDSTESTVESRVEGLEMDDGLAPPSSSLPIPTSIGTSTRSTRQVAPRVSNSTSSHPNTLASSTRRQEEIASSGSPDAYADGHGRSNPQSARRDIPASPPPSYEIAIDRNRPSPGDTPTSGSTAGCADSASNAAAAAAGMQGWVPGFQQPSDQSDIREGEGVILNPDSDSKSKRPFATKPKADLTSPSHSGHPLRFSQTDAATHHPTHVKLPLSNSIGILEHLPDSDSDRSSEGLLIPPHPDKSQSQRNLPVPPFSRTRTEPRYPRTRSPLLVRSTSELSTQGDEERLEMYLSSSSSGSEDEEVSDREGATRSRRQGRRNLASSQIVSQQRYRLPVTQNATARKGTGRRRMSLIEIIDRSGSGNSPVEAADDETVPGPTGHSTGAEVHARATYTDSGHMFRPISHGRDHDGAFTRDVHILGWKIVGGKDKLVNASQPVPSPARGGFGAYVVYECEIETKNGAKIHRMKRYTDFEALRKELKKKLPHLRYTLPPLPAKNNFSRFEPTFLAKRQGRLDFWLRTVLLHSEMGSNEVVKKWVLEP